MGHATEATCPATCGLNGDSCGMDCATEVGQESCNATACGESFNPNCPPTGGGTESANGTLCGTRYNCSNSCTAAYGCTCTRTMSFDYTFCNDTLCC